MWRRKPPARAENLAGDLTPPRELPRAPTLIWNTKEDELVDPVAQAEALAKAWCAGGGTVELQMLPGLGHGVSAPANLRPQLTWLENAFDGQAPVSGTCVGVG